MTFTIVFAKEINQLVPSYWHYKFIERCNNTKLMNFKTSKTTIFLSASLLDNKNDLRINLTTWLYGLHSFPGQNFISVYLNLFVLVAFMLFSIYKLLYILISQVITVLSRVYNRIGECQPTSSIDYEK